MEKQKRTKVQPGEVSLKALALLPALRPLARHYFRLTIPWNSEWIPETIPDAEIDRVLDGPQAFWFMILQKGVKDKPKELPWPVGLIGIHKYSPIDGTAETLIALDPEARGLNIAEEATALLTEWVRKNTTVRRGYSHCLDGCPTIPFLRRAGFVKEGTLDKARFKNGKYVNVQIWTLFVRE